MGFAHTIFYSLEELYFPMLLFPVIIWSINKNKYLSAGFILSLIGFSRLSYILLCAGIYIWWLTKEGWDLKKNTQFVSGFIVGTFCILIPFVIVSGTSIIEQNFVANSFLPISKEGNNLIFLYLKSFGDYTGIKMGRITLSLIAVVLILLFSVRCKNFSKEHPFWNISFAALLATTIVFTPIFSADYILMIIVSLSWGMAYSMDRNTNSLW